MVYAFVHRPSEIVFGYHVLDLSVWREHEYATFNLSNEDGTWFRAYSLSRFPSEMVVAREVVPDDWRRFLWP